MPYLLLSMPKPKQSKVVIDLPDAGKIPVLVIRESRRNLRASIGKKSLIFRLPLSTTHELERKHWNWFMNWARKISQQKDGQLIAHLQPKLYENSSTLVVGHKSYQLIIENAARKTIGVSLKDAVVSLKLPHELRSPEREMAIKKALSRIIAADYLPEITERVHLLNNAYFTQPIGQVRLKYNHSNWGSCSNRGNINLSTRLLFAPQPVVDYVIIHELAHRLEFNHSERFWKLVERAMPNYPKAEKWLKENYHMCDF